MIKKHKALMAYMLALAIFTTYVVMDTFVISRVYGEASDSGIEAELQQGGNDGTSGQTQDGTSDDAEESRSHGPGSKPGNGSGGHPSGGPGHGGKHSKSKSSSGSSSTDGSAGSSSSDSPDSSSDSSSSSGSDFTGLGFSDGDRLLHAVDLRYFVLHAHIDAEPFPHALRRHQEERTPVFDHVAHMVRQAAVCIRNIRAAFQDHDLAVRVQSSQSGCAACAAGNAADDDGFSLFAHGHLLIIVSSFPAQRAA